MSGKNSWSLSEEVYKVDPLNRKPPYKTGDTFTGKDKIEYKIIKAKNDSGSGFQAMAAVPKVNEKWDYHHITVAYAGTNPGDWHDYVADGTDINMNYWSHNGGSHAKSGQFKEAEAFYNSVVNDKKLKAKGVKEKYIKKIVGHSLGGALALYIAGLKSKSADTFSAANPTMYLTKEEIKWLNKHPELIKNYYHEGDIVAEWLTINGLGSSLACSEFYANATGVGALMNGHLQGSYRFDKNGDPKLTPDSQMELSMLLLGDLKKKLKEGGLTKAEKIFLDQAEALVITNNIATIASDGIDKSIKECNKGIEKTQKIWRDAITSARDLGGNLTEDERLGALKQGGATKKTIVDESAEYFNKKITKLNDLKKEYQDLVNNMKTVINKTVEEDKELAGIFDAIPI